MNNTLSIAELLENIQELILEFRSEKIRLLTFGFFQYITELLKKATKSIYIANYNIAGAEHELREFWEIVANKNKNGVETKIIVNTRFGSLRGKQRQEASIQYLQAKGIHVTLFPKSRIFHLKLITIDEKHSIIGSHNLTREGVKNAINLSVHIEDEMLTKEINKFVDTIIESAEYENSLREQK